MAGTPAVRVTGAKEFRKAMRGMGADLRDLTAINKRAAQLVADSARGKSPVLSGDLRGTIRAGATVSRGYVLAGSRSVPYAGPIHFGWPRRNIAPQPFLYDALDDRRDEVIGQYEAHIDALVEKVGRDTPP